ncbi:MAG: hypothetical protein P9L97_05085, partial [Candidatus Tenebribacter davisii]|nr:hypothetical protein [Candidatus Tenebribacter davisii]
LSTKACKSKVTINESNQVVKYVNLKNSLQLKIKVEVQKLLSENSKSIDELQNLSLAYIDLPRTSIKQKNTLVGQFGDIFGDKVSKHKAAVDTLIMLFRDVENELNKGNRANLLDAAKRVSSVQITEAIDIITKQQLGFELWRSKKNELSIKLEIPIAERTIFEFNFVNSFDLFKDLLQAEHQKILLFVRKNTGILTTTFTETECIEKLYEEFNKNNRTQLKPIELKAAICAAFIMIEN